MNRTIVLTGSTRGCGRALVDAFVGAGHTVIGCGTRAELVRELGEIHGSPHAFSVVDVTSESDVESWAMKILEEHGAPDLLLNNAGVINRNAPLWKVPAEEFDRVLEVNVGGTARIIRHFVPAMIERGSGIVANFSSTWGRTTSPEVAPYCATKWAVEGLTQSLSQELPAGLAAVAVNPGIIHTEMLESCFAGGAASYPTPKVWAKQAAPFLLALSARDNGRSVTVG